MFLLFLALWIIFNGRITAEILIFGVVISAVMYWFLWKFMGFHPQSEIRSFQKAFYIIQYIFYLIREIVAANFATIRLITSANYEVEPVLIQFETTLKSDIAKFMLANSITLTPGTLTVAIEQNRFTVHCLDKTLAEGITDSIFVKLLTKIESK